MRNIQYYYLHFISLTNLADVKNHDTRSLPFASETELYREYKKEMELTNVPAHKIAKRTVFQSVFRSMPHVKLKAAKGTIDTCDICNNCDDLSRGRAKKDPAHLEAIRTFKKIHLKHQHHERKVADHALEESKKQGPDGQPIQYYIDIDGMTELTGNFPKYCKQDFNKY